jgi:hypothetical protein
MNITMKTTSYILLVLFAILGLSAGGGVIYLASVDTKTDRLAKTFEKTEASLRGRNKAFRALRARVDAQDRIIAQMRESISAKKSSDAGVTKKPTVEKTRQQQMRPKAAAAESKSQPTKPTLVDPTDQRW